MLLKRQFNKKGEVTHLDVQIGQDVGKEWHPSDRVVFGGMAEGWLSIAGGKLTIKTGPDVDDHVFEIVAPPGVFCCHCGEKLEAGNEVAQKHVASDHAGGKSPDESHPAGYRQDNFFRLVRVS
jgi:hypothetical protein